LYFFLCNLHVTARNGIVSNSYYPLQLNVSLFNCWINFPYMSYRNNNVSISCDYHSNQIDMIFMWKMCMVTWVCLIMKWFNWHNPHIPQTLPILWELTLVLSRLGTIFYHVNLCIEKIHCMIFMHLSFHAMQFSNAYHDTRLFCYSLQRFHWLIYWT
jgi:hypothetical protein